MILVLPFNSPLISCPSCSNRADFSSWRRPSCYCLGLPGCWRPPPPKDGQPHSWLRLCFLAICVLLLSSCEISFPAFTNGFSVLPLPATTRWLPCISDSAISSHRLAAARLSYLHHALQVCHTYQWRGQISRHRQAVTQHYRSVFLPGSLQVQAYFPALPELKCRTGFLVYFYAFRDKHKPLLAITE